MYATQRLRSPFVTLTGFVLFSVILAHNGITATKLNDTLPSGGDVGGFGGSSGSYRISPDNSRVVYTADKDTNGVEELYSVPIGGGTVIKLNAPLVSGGDVARTGLK